jgi:hypothetical protein
MNAEPLKTSLEQEPLLTSRELAARLRISMHQLKEMRRKVAIPFIKLNRNSHRYKWGEVCVALDAPREEVKMPERVFTVAPSNKPGYPFYVIGSPNGKKERSFFRTEAEAEEHARKRSAAVGRKPIAPLPRRARGMEPEAPFYRVGPYSDPKNRPDLRYEVSVYFEGKVRPKYWRFRTEREALHFANCKNLRPRSRSRGRKSRRNRRRRRRARAMRRVHGSSRSHGPRIN